MNPRGYSREFAPDPREKRRQIAIDRVPMELHDAIKAKAKRDGVSLRALILGWLRDWVSK